MPNWKKVLLNNSDAVLSSITASGDISASGTLSIPGFPDVATTLGTIGGGGGFQVFQTGSVNGSIIPAHTSVNATNSGIYSSILAGCQQTIGGAGDYSAIIGGLQNSLNSGCSIVAGGSQNKIHSDGGSNCTYVNQNTIIGGTQNHISGSGDTLARRSIQNTIIGSYLSSVEFGCAGIILGGCQSKISGSQASSYNAILNGKGSQILAPPGNATCRNTVIGGCDTKIISAGSDNAILGGTCNTISGSTACKSVIIGGNNHLLLNNQNGAIIGGLCVTASNSQIALGLSNADLSSCPGNTTYVRNLNIYGTNGSNGCITGVSKVIAGEGIFGTGTTTINDNISSTGDIELTGSIHAKTDITASGKFVGTELKTPAGPNDLILDADGADIILKDDAAAFGRFKRDNSDFVIKSEGRNRDIIFKGNDDGTAITSLTLDMSDGGKALFKGGAQITGSLSVSGSSVEFITSAGVPIFSIAETGSFTLGEGAEAANDAQVAIGKNASASGATSIAIGNNAGADGSGGVAIGNSATNGTNGLDSVAIGNSATTTQYGVAIGGSTPTAALYGVAIGNSTSATTSGISIGRVATTTDANGAIAIGESSAAGDRGLAIGYQASSSAQNAIAIGRDARATGTRSVMINLSATTPRTNSTTDSLEVNFNDSTSTFRIGKSVDSWINTSANFGIGTTTPGEKLEVIGNISSSGTITMLTASIGGGIFTSASLAAGGGGGFTPSLSTDLPAQNITASANISASGTITSGTIVANTSTVTNANIVNLLVDGPSSFAATITSSVATMLSGSGSVVANNFTASGTLSIPGFPDVSASLAATPGTDEFKAVSQSVFLGENAGENQIAGVNPVTGDTIDSENVGIGYQALQNTTNGTNNIAIGSEVLNGNTTGFNNIAISKGALGNFTGSNTTIGIGFDAGAPHENSGLIEGHIGNTMVGHQAIDDFNIKSTAEISNNTAVGLRALRGLGGTGASSCVNNVKNNTAVGRQAGLNIIHATGGALNHNTFLGNSAGMNAVPQQGNMLSNLLLGARAGMSGYIGSNNIVLQNATGDTALGNADWGVSENISIGGNGALYSDNNIIISNASSSVLNTIGTSSISTETLSTNQSGNVIIGGHSNNISNIGNRTSKDNSIINSTTMTIGNQGSGGSDENFVASAKGINVQGDRNILLGVELTTSDPTQILEGDKNTIINSTGFNLSDSTKQNTIIGSTCIRINQQEGKNAALHSQNIDFNTGNESISIKSIGTSYTGSDKSVALLDSNSNISGDSIVLINTANITDDGIDNIYIGGQNHTATNGGVSSNVFIGGNNQTAAIQADDNIFLGASNGEMSGSFNILAGSSNDVGANLKHSFIHGAAHDVKPSSQSQRNVIVGYQHEYTTVGNNSFIGGTKGNIAANNSFGFGKGINLSYENMGAFGKFNDKTANASSSSLFTVGCGGSANSRRNAINIVADTVNEANNKAIVYLDQLVDFNFADDEAAMTAGIGVGGLYHTNGTVKIRLE